MPQIDDGKSISCIDERLKDSVEKVQFTKNDKIQEATDEYEIQCKFNTTQIRRNCKLNKLQDKRNIDTLFNIPFQN